MTAKLQAASLAALSGINHAFFTREGGVSEGIYASLNGGIGSNDHPDRVAENRARMACGVGVHRDRLLTAYQVHSPDVVIVAAPWTPDRRPRADALVTKEPGLGIAITTADCGPILFADERAGVVAAAHAGWRGAAGGVIEATIAAMERCGADRARVVAALGPMIRQQSYEVGLYRGAPGRRRHSPHRGHRSLHLLRSGAILQLSALHASQRKRLRPAYQRHRARALSESTAPQPHIASGANGLYQGA
jgi:YfiH family protein